MDVAVLMCTKANRPTARRLDHKQRDGCMQGRLEQFAHSTLDQEQQADEIASLKQTQQSLELHCHASECLIDELKVLNQRLGDDLAEATGHQEPQHHQTSDHHHLNLQLQQ